MIKKHLLALATIASVGILPLAAQAADFQDNRWYVAPFGSFVQPGGDRNAKGGWGGGLGVGKIINEHFNVEMRGFYQGMSTDGGRNGRWDMTGGTADAQYFFFRDKFSPYTVLGLGAMNTSTNSDSGIGFIGEAGAGFTYELHDNFLLRSDVRYRYNNNFNANLQSGTDEFHDLVVNVGFVVPLGAKPKAAPKVEAPIVAAAVVPEPSCSTLDGDNDGVNDCDDACPTTLPGVQVSIRGCWIVDVKFDNDKDIIKPQYFGNLDNTSKAIKDHPELKIEIQGHTSKTGSFKHNMNLSERRALAVKKYLVDGTHSPNLTTKGYGWTRPIDSNDTEAGRANNRRVQLEVDGQPQQPLK